MNQQDAHLNKASALKEDPAQLHWYESNQAKRLHDQLKNLTGDVNGRQIIIAGEVDGQAQSVAITLSETQAKAFRIDLSAIISKYIGETEKNFKDRLFKDGSIIVS